jgi:hypothetical protein
VIQKSVSEWGTAEPDMGNLQLLSNRDQFVMSRADRQLRGT